MLCDICKKREAKIYYTEIINGQKQEQHLCEECAAEHTSFVLKNGAGKELTLGGLLSGLILGAAGAQAEKQKELVCPVCGLGYEEFLKKGRFGCAECYHAFEPALEKLLKNIHGADRHCGKRLKGFIPAKEPAEEALHAPLKERNLTELERLEFQLQQAVEKEEYEDAARLRDEIRRRKAEQAKAKDKTPPASGLVSPEETPGKAAADGRGGIS